MSASTLSPPPGAARTETQLSREKKLIAALTVLALALRVSSLSRSLFTDEAYSLALAQRGFPHMLGLFGYEANGTPYPIVLWPLIRIFGESETLLRLPAVLAGTASVPALWWAARRYTTPAAALVAAALLALNPMAVFYSQFARPYAFVMLAACLAFGALPRALQRGGARGPWVGYVLAMALLAYCDILAAPIAIPAQALIAWRAGRDAFRRWLLSLGALLLCCVPLLIAAAIAHGRRNALYWLPKPDRGLVMLALQEFAGGFSEVSAVRWATIGAGAVVVGAALWSLRGRGAGAERSTLVTAIAWGILPPLLLLIVSFARPLFWPRYAIIALPGLCLLFAVAGEHLWRSRRGLLLAAPCIGAIALVSLFADVRQRDKRQENWPPAAAWLRAARTSSQPVILDNVLSLPVLGYYDAAFRAPGGESVVQEWHDRPLPVNVVGFKDPGGYGAVANGPPSAAEIAALARRGAGTVWMLTAQYDKTLQGDLRTGPPVAWSRAHCRVQTRESTGVWVMRASSCRG